MCHQNSVRFTDGILSLNDSLGSIRDGLQIILQYKIGRLRDVCRRLDDTPSIETDDYKLLMTEIIQQQSLGRINNQLVDLYNRKRQLAKVIKAKNQFNTHGNDLDETTIEISSDSSSSIITFHTIDDEATNSTYDSTN